MDALTLTERAAAISKTAASLASELSQTGHPEPTFEHGLPVPLHGDAPDSKAKNLKKQLLHMADELRALVTEPYLHLTPQEVVPHSIHPIHKLGIAKNFPENGTTVVDLAQSLNLRESLVRRLLAHSATHHVFYEAAPDFYIHTAASRLLATKPRMGDWIDVGCDEMYPASFKIADALAKYPKSEEPGHCGWSVANNTDKPIFRALADMPERAGRFAGAMKWLGHAPAFSPQGLVDVFPWAPTSNGSQFTVVDVGGGLGHVSLALAASEQGSKAQFIIQDLGDIVAQGQSALPNDKDLQEKIHFQVHDFFEEQPVHGADVYLLRMILHDWSDKYAIKILRALVPALKPGAKVVINDRVIPGRHQVHYLEEREARDSDMLMLSFQNAQERTEDDWRALLMAADGRFEMTAVQRLTGYVLGVVEVTWRG